MVTKACALDDVSDVIVNAKESDAEVVVGSRLKTGHEVVDHKLVLNRNQIWIQNNSWIFTDPVL